jgi:UDP:flavonoid glycosyltransferase YjiC (YdhE family)
MPRILLAPLGSHGDVHPFIGLGLALRSRGHDVRFITSAHFKSLIESLGFPFSPVGTDDDYHALVNNPDLWHPSRSMKAIFGNGGIASRHLRDGYARIQEQHLPGETILAAGLLAFWARSAAEKLNIPLASVHLQPSVMWSAASTPEFATLRFREWWPHWFRNSLFWYGDRFVADPLIGPELNAFRAEIGLPPVKRIVGKWGHSPQRIIGLFPAWYGNAPDWPAHFRHAGFVRFDQADSFPVPDEVERFLSAGEPPIVFSFGSAMRQGKPYFTAAAEACKLLGRRGLLLAKGRDQIPESLPSGVLHADYAPFSKVFPRAAAVVHHGGIGTCAQGLAAGVPQLVMPLAFDQPDNARRLEKLGVGARVWPKRFTPKRVAAALFELLDSPATVMRAKDVAEQMTEGDPAARASELIEEMTQVRGVCR